MARPRRCFCCFSNIAGIRGCIRWCPPCKAQCRPGHDCRRPIGDTMLPAPERRGIEWNPLPSVYASAGVVAVAQ